MSVVYVIQEMPGRNLHPARQYGKLEAILPPYQQIVLSPGPMIYRLRRHLKNFCDDDYLLLMGDPIAIGAAMFIAANYNNGRVNVLKWDKQEKDYYPVELDFFKTGSLD